MSSPVPVVGAVQSVNVRIIPAVSLRPLLVDAVERGIARELERTGHAR